MKSANVRWLTACLLGVPLLGSGASAQSPRPHEHDHPDVVVEGSGSPPVWRATWADSARASRSGEVWTTPDNQILLELAREDTTAANLFDLNGRTLVFRPDGWGGYSREVQALDWEDTLGTEVTLEWERHRDGVEVAFGAFEFDYAGRRWNSVFMSKHGLLTFGAPVEYSKHFEAWFSPMSESARRLATTPTISALYKPAFGGLYGRDPLASQFVARFPDRVVATWFASEYDAYRLDVPDDAERFQAVLHADGTIQLNYGRITVGDGVVGLFSDVVEKGDLIAFVPDATDSGLPGHLDLLEVALYETGADTVILEFTTREPIPEPTTGFYNYRLYFDTDLPYSHDWSDIDFVWKIEIGGDNSVWGGESRAGDRANQIELVADIGDLQGLSASVWAAADEYDDDGSFVRGDNTTPVSLRLPAMAPVDLSASDRRSSRTQREVFHYLGPPAMAALACRIIDNLGDQFDLFVFHNEFRVDFQMNDSAWRNYHNGVRGIGRNGGGRPPCGDGRLMGHYEHVVRIPHAGGRSRDWRNGDFKSDLTLFAHEFIHSWTSYLSYVQNDGIRRRLFADSCRCHWRGTLHAPAAFPWGGDEARSVMMGGEGGGFWRDNGDGTFTATTDFGDASGLSWLDLYAMGLAEASEVPDLFVLRNLEPVTGHDSPRWSGQYWGTFHADKEIVSIDQIVAAMGRREPPATRSQKEFNAGFVYLLAPGQKAATPELLKLHKEYIDRVVEYWSHVTGGRSQITTTVPGGGGGGGDEPDQPIDPGRTTPRMLDLTCHGYDEGATRAYNCIPVPSQQHHMRTFVPAVGSACDRGSIAEFPAGRIVFQIRCHDGSPGQSAAWSYSGRGRESFVKRVDTPRVWLRTSFSGSSAHLSVWCRAPRENLLVNELLGTSWGNDGTNGIYGMTGCLEVEVDTGAEDLQWWFTQDLAATALTPLRSWKHETGTGSTLGAEALQDLATAAELERLWRQPDRWGMNLRQGASTRGSVPTSDDDGGAKLDLSIASGPDDDTDALDGAVLRGAVRTSPLTLDLTCHGYDEGATRAYNCIPEPSQQQHMRTFVPAVGSACDGGRVAEFPAGRIVFQIRCRDNSPGQSGAWSYSGQGPAFFEKPVDTPRVWLRTSFSGSSVHLSVWCRAPQENLVVNELLGKSWGNDGTNGIYGMAGCREVEVNTEGQDLQWWFTQDLAATALTPPRSWERASGADRALPAEARQDLGAAAELERRWSRPRR